VTVTVTVGAGGPGPGTPAVTDSDGRTLTDDPSHRDRDHGGPGPVVGPVRRPVAASDSLGGGSLDCHDRHGHRDCDRAGGDSPVTVTPAAAAQSDSDAGGPALSCLGSEPPGSEPGGRRAVTR
jgi:hypothetical protein